MATRFGVLEHYQAPHERPRRFVKKSVAQMYLRRAEAREVGRYLIQMLLVRAAVEHISNSTTPHPIAVPQLHPPDPTNVLYFTRYPLPDLRTCEYSE